MTDQPDQTPAEPLVDYDTWTAEAERGAVAAHQDATTGERTPSEDVVAEGPAFWSGYNAHVAALRNAGVIA